MRVVDVRMQDVCAHSKDGRALPHASHSGEISLAGSLRRDLPGGLKIACVPRCGSARPFRARCCPSQKPNTVHPPPADAHPLLCFVASMLCVSASHRARACVGRPGAATCVSATPKQGEVRGACGVTRARRASQALLSACINICERAHGGNFLFWLRVYQFIPHDIVCICVYIYIFVCVCAVILASR